MSYDIRYDPDYVTIPRSTYEHLSACYLSPLSGMRDLGAVLVREWGHDPEQHPDLMDELEIELSAAHIETAADLMRQHGLRDLRVEPAPASA
ncbi:MULTISPECIES: hypothetical protein [Streptomyces]|uniref:Uncharacterized protein n=1 Tax=Streptomyces tricolor TaxID=68277 RepID=A0ABS9J7Z1_9ACTN|nr:hypothetical protein [Streptomyces tricolor]MCG0061683.1 hypothetical protein [Streptomyces tricolor]MYU30660.1 hypothetical protein [Streptomyces sp. SID7810]CUW31733.1 hypothetical protein TUE45_06482 [Streptomyces reticuli]